MPLIIDTGILFRYDPVRRACGVRFEETPHGKVVTTKNYHYFSGEIHAIVLGICLRELEPVESGTRRMEVEQIPEDRKRQDISEILRKRGYHELIYFS